MKKLIVGLLLSCMFIGGCTCRTIADDRNREVMIDRIYTADDGSEVWALEIVRIDF